MSKATVHRALRYVALAVALALQAAVPTAAGQTGEWRAYAADKASTKYTPLDQINADTVQGPPRGLAAVDDSR